MTTQQQNTDDSRVRRTRKIIQEALINLTVEKGYNRISVQNIVDRAGINRSTYYRHYLDKDDLLSKYMDDVTGVIFQNDEIDEEDQEGILSGLIKLLNHIQTFSEFYRIMLSTDGHPLVSERLRQKVENRFRIHVTEITKTQCKKGSVIELQLRSMSGAGIGAILWWVENNIPCTAEELAVWIGQLSAVAVAQAMQPSSLPSKPNDQF
ncbi:MAG: TetR/AcrR family transcriptional regulator [Anaerolineae bacterium]|nr:TetR/AcrR family transcriptional regulator [Anaerolineae bacterium]